MLDAPAAAGQFQLALGLSPTLARLLAARGWRETSALAEFLYPRLEHTHSPWLMLGMEPAVTRILAALAAGEPVRILGDYDADGTLATVLLRQALLSLAPAAAANVTYRLPERLGDGYGLTVAAIEQAASDGVRLAITVDTGIRELEALRRARELSLDVIVTDHHLPGPALPDAFAILNPHQPACPYPDKNLCGSGVAFKLVHALLERAGHLDGAWPPRLRSYLKLVALATVADAVPLLGENRVLTRFGLLGLAEPVNPGLRALLDLALPNRARASAAPRASDVAFRIAPRLNAAGRMGRADDVVELFAAPPAAALALARKLEALNLERQQLCDRIQAEIEARLAAEPIPAAPASDLLLLAGENWHRGVLGIVANRLLERTGKAAAVVAIENGFAYGSCRAPAGFALLERLEACSDLLLRFGGHAQAAGFTLATANLEALRQRLCSPLPAAPTAAGDPAPAAPEAAAFEVSLAELTPAFARELARLEPFGEANPEPRFRARALTLAAPPLRLKDRHLKLTLEQEGARLPALFWNLWRDGVYQPAPRRPAFESLAPGARLDVTFRLGYENHPDFGERVQLILQDFVTAPAPAES